MDDFKNELLKCRICKNKFGFEPNPIFFGNKNSKIMQISQAPSKKVSISQLPFTDLSGIKLKYEWYKITDEEFYNPNNFYITALAHCYPGKNKNGKDNNPPKICFNKWTQKELELVDNIIYIIIGAKAAKIFFPNEKFKDLVFKNNTLNNKTAIVLPHPSPLNFRWLIKNPDFENKRIKEIQKILKDII